jgi:DNA-binding transcriptional LysR family regulator
MLAEWAVAMNIRQIETLYWAARLGSFAKAAQRLNATQSAVSMRIQEVEARLDAVLFDRSLRNARLTPKGAMLLPHIEEVLLAYGRLIDAAAPDSRQIAGYVRLGVTENVAVTWLGAMIKALKTRHPLIQIELEIGVSHTLEEKLYARNLDMAIAACELPPSKFYSTSLQSIDFRWMCSPSLEGVPAVLTPESLAELPVLSVTREWQARGSLLKWFTENKIHYRNVTICNTFRTTASMAIDGLGLAQLPVRLFRDELRQGLLRMVQAEPEIPPLEIHAIRPAGDDSAVYRMIESAAREAAADS